PACGGNIKVPGEIDLATEEQAAAELMQAHTTTLLLPDRQLEIPWEQLRRMCAIGVLVLVSIAGLLWVIELASRDSTLAWTSTASPGASNVPLPRVSSALPPAPPREVAESGTPDSLAATAPAASSTVAATRLPHGVQDWYGQAGARHAGIRR